MSEKIDLTQDLTDEQIKELAKSGAVDVAKELKEASERFERHIGFKAEK